ncbi:hypothetical protein ACFQ1S_23440, partial [Kibdelosporangium lantanae]
GLNASEWTPRELRHSFVSLLSDSGIPIEKISLLVGHSSTGTCRGCAIVSPLTGTAWFLLDKN